MGRSRSRRVAALGVLLAGLPGCVTGHLLDAARRRERALVIERAERDGDRVVLHYVAEVSDDAGTVLGTTAAAAALPLAVLRASEAPRADAVTPAWRRAGSDPRGRSVSLVREAPEPSSPGPTLEVVAEEGRDTALVWHDGAGTPPWAPVPAAALTRQRTAPWAWPLAPAALAVDAVVVPVLLFFAPAVIVIGE